MITKKQNLMTAKPTNSTDIAEKCASSKPSDSPSNRKLMYACINRDVTMAKQALMQGANINHRTISNITPLLVAAEHGDVDLIDLLCSQANSIIDLQDMTIYGSTPLHLAVLFGHKEAMQELLNRGALTNCCDNLGRYPLHFAAMHRNVDAARILLKFGAWVNVYDAFSESPLYYSVMRRPSVAMARLLLVNGASSDPPPNSLGMGLLLEAVLSVCTNSDFDAIKALIWSGGNVNVTDPVAWRTPLHLVAINGHFELAEYLIRHGADLHAKNRAGQTPLEVAFNYRNLKIAYLIEESRRMQTTSYTSQILQSTEGSDEMCNRMDELFKSNYKLELCSRLITRDTIVRSGRQCRNDEERFIFALEIILRHSAILFDSECKQKDSQHSIRSRNNGNKSFAIGKYYEAVKNYTESIVYAVDSSEELALTYANRSAALFKLKKFEACIVDIDRALNQKYSDRLKTKSKLYKRKGLCLLSLGRPGADSAFQEGLVWLAKMDMSEGEMNKSRRKLRKLISDPSIVSKPPTNVIKYPLPEIVVANPEIPCASEAVAVRYSKKLGRHLVATRQIKPGEILIVENPYCLRLIPKHVYTHCSYCLQVSWNLIPCAYCINVAYCSEVCKDKAWDEYHEMECPVVGLLLDFKFNNVLYMSLRTTIIGTRKGVNLNELKAELINVDRNTDPRTKGYSDDGKFHSNQYCSIYSLADNVEKCSAQDLFIRSLWVAQTVCMLARETTMFGKKLKLNTLAKNSDVIFVGGLMIKHVNAIFVNAQSFGPSRSSSTSEHGHALLAVSNLLNHSCDANTFRQWYTDHMAVYAVYPIKKGEQIFDNYGPRFSEMPKSARQEFFEGRWHFTCECRPCIENWSPFHLPSYKDQLISPQNKSKLDEVMRKFKIRNLPIQKDIRENSPDMLDQLLEMIDLLFKLAQRPCAELIMALSWLKDYYTEADAMFEYEPISLSTTAEARLMSHIIQRTLRLPTKF